MSNNIIFLLFTVIVSLNDFRDSTANQDPPSKSQPNIIIMLMDDLGYETAIQGDTMKNIGRTVALDLPIMRDSLSTKGLVFTKAFASPVCTPSRVQMMTGQYLYRTYQQFGQINWNSRTLAQNLSWNGYNTAVGGKWQLQGNTVFKSPSAFEEDYFPLNLENPKRLGYQEYMLHAVLENGQIYSNCSNYYFDDGTTACDSADFGPYVVLDYFKDFVDRHKGKNRPFFFDYRMLLPHDPFLPMPGDLRYPIDTLNDAWYLPDMITLTDSIIGAVVQCMDSIPELQEGAGTVLLVLSDNGSSRGWYTNNPKGNPVLSWAILTKLNGIGEFNGDKSLSTYLGTHIPAFAYYVGPHKKYMDGETFDKPIGLIDVYATVMDLAKLEHLNKYDGVSFADEIVDYVPDRPDREMLFQYYNPFFDQLANLRSGTNINSFVTDGDYWLDSRGRFYDLVDSMDWNLLSPFTPTSGNALTAFNTMDSIIQSHPKAEEFAKPLINTYD
ncbi:MAG: sulfatase-like hydrolase/transferase [Saprospiraceae bacterium]|nr:sulfatase-like hydrolase/transferase [Saprospiraceae bacterium]